MRILRGQYFFLFELIPLNSAIILPFPLRKLIIVGRENYCVIPDCFTNWSYTFREKLPDYYSDLFFASLTLNGLLLVLGALYHKYSVLNFGHIRSLQHEIQNHSKVEGSRLYFFLAPEGPASVSNFVRLFSPKGLPFNVLIFCNKSIFQKAQRPPFTIFGIAKFSE